MCNGVQRVMVIQNCFITGEYDMLSFGCSESVSKKSGVNCMVEF